MAKKKAKKKAKPAIKQAVKKLKASDSLNEPLESVEKFDFGGIPDLDLKKNLGCG